MGRGEERQAAAKPLLSEGIPLHFLSCRLSFIKLVGSFWIVSAPLVFLKIGRHFFFPGHHRIVNNCLSSAQFSGALKKNLNFTVVFTVNDSS